MAAFGNENKEIKTISDLKYLLHELTEVHKMNDDCRIKFFELFGPEIHIYAAGDISYSENEALINAETEK